MLYIHGMGHFHPDNVIDNQFLETLDIGTNNQWIMERVGIKTRRTVLDLDYLKKTKNVDPALAAKNAKYTGVQTAKKAGEMALKRAKLKPADIGLVIAGGCAPEYALPATACVMADSLGIGAPCMDVASACSTFAAHMHLLNQLSDNLPDYALMIQAENWTRTIDFSDRKTAVLIGDATVATIVSKKHVAPFKVDNTLLMSNPSGWDKVQTPAGKHFMQEGPAVQKFAIKKTIATIRELEALSGFDVTAHYFIGHQANLTMLESVAFKLGVDKQKHLYNVDVFGNCGSAGGPSVLSQHWGKFKKSDVLFVAVVGAGLTWGGMTIEVQ